jgi:hypothetical protein
VLASFVATTGAATGRLALATTGNGSWLDFGVDAFACLTFGTGRFFGKILRTLAENSDAAAQTLIESERAGMIAKGEEHLHRVAGVFDERTTGTDSRDNPPLGSRRVDYALAVPGRPNQWLILVFTALDSSDPDDRYATVLVELFDAIMSTFRWAWD